MPSELSEADRDELARLRREYEASLSWRLTRPVRAVGRLGRSLRPRSSPDDIPGPPVRDSVDSWLEQFYGERLETIDAACAGGVSTEQYALFRDLDDDVWALLLTQQYESYAHIKALLPGMPEPELQALWNGRSGLGLASQSTAFYSKLLASYERHGTLPLWESSVLASGAGGGGSRAISYGT